MSSETQSSYFQTKTWQTFDSSAFLEHYWTFFKLNWGQQYVKFCQNFYFWLLENFKEVCLRFWSPSVLWLMNQNVPNRKNVIFGKILRLKSRNLSTVWRGTVLPQSAAFCGSPPRSTGALPRPLSPESAALYWRTGALYCRSRRSLSTAWLHRSKRPKRYFSGAGAVMAARRPL